MDYGSDGGATFRGNWTAIARGKSNATGVGLIEVYRVQ